MLHSPCVRMLSLGNTQSSTESINTCISSSSREWFSTESKLPADALSSDEVSSGDLLRRLMESKLAASPDTCAAPLVLLLLLSLSVMLAALSLCVTVSSCASDWWLWSGRLRCLGGSGGGSLQGESQLSDMRWTLQGNRKQHTAVNYQKQSWHQCHGRYLFLQRDSKDSKSSFNTAPNNVVSF